MNKRIEILKKIALHGKEKNRSPKLIKIELAVAFTILFFAAYLSGLIKNIIKKTAEKISSHKKTTFAIVFAGVVICVLFCNSKILHKNNDKNSLSNRNSSNQEKTIEKESESESETESFADVGKPEEEYLPAESIESESEVVDQAENNDEQINNTDYTAYQPRDYTAEELAAMSFYIKVNRLMNTVTIYTLDDNGEYTIPVKAMRCSTGGDGTPLGVFTLKERYTFRRLLFDVYGQYATRIEGQILFHSSSYSNGYKDTLIASEFNKLGDSVSHGCIRLTTADAKWIYDYCKEGTVVEIYDDENPGPLGKPDVIHMPEDDEVLSKWDPTDDYEGNPWNEKQPTIEVEDHTINVGDDVDVVDFAQAYDTCGNSINEKINVEGYVDVTKAGAYTVKYSVTDLLGRTASKTVTITVKN